MTDKQGSYFLSRPAHPLPRGAPGPVQCRRAKSCNALDIYNISSWRRALIGQRGLGWTDSAGLEDIREAEADPRANVILWGSCFWWCLCSVCSQRTGLSSGKGAGEVNITGGGAAPPPGVWSNLGFKVRRSAQISLSHASSSPRVPFPNPADDIPGCQDCTCSALTSSQHQWGPAHS